MKKDAYRILICSDTDYDELVAEIYIEEKFVALVATSDDGRIVADFPWVENKDAATNRVDFFTFVAALGAAKRVHRPRASGHTEARCRSEKAARQARSTKCGFGITARPSG